MQLRLLEYFVVLARERHFARAAAACHVSQPALSAGLVALEQTLGSRLVDRDRRFIALTEKGETILPWAQQVLATVDSLRIAADTATSGLRGDLRLGAIPASLPVVGSLVRAIRKAQPNVTVSIRAMTSRDIVAGLSAFELDAGVTYLDHEPPLNVVSVALYAETPVFLTRVDSELGALDQISLADVLAGPLGLLHEGMQNRRILDASLALRGLVAEPCVTADSYVALFAMAETGDFGTIIPDAYSVLAPTGTWAKVIPFEEALPSSRVGLIISDHSPTGQMAKVALAAARSLGSNTELHRY